jgi:UDP:flavonoid glycosyltransferase YjiC (YdhE family)
MRRFFARAACVVTHGGAGVTQKALAARVPVCVVPFGRDQLEVARRVEVAQAGTRLPARQLNPDRLRAKIREAMTKHAGVGRVADGFAATGGPTAAAHAVEGLLNRHSNNPPSTQTPTVRSRSRQTAAAWDADRRVRGRPA